MDANMNTVRAYRSTITIPTYPIGPADPNPPFPEGRRTDIYPYPMLDDLTEKRADRTYLALVLENRYLRLIVLPELGGHLYSAYDKIGQREIFYRNHVVKPGLVALRGAWISGGIEFNFPIGHSVTTVSPVDWRIEQHKDSATVWIGDLERVSRMQWWVGLTLRADYARIEQQVVLCNRTPLRRRYYFWSNAAVRASEGLQFICPTDYRKVHGHIGPYPIDNGRDLSWYRNHEHAADVFAYQVREDWFGWYNHDEDAGCVHVANAPECLGKKMFTWGTHDDGRIWDEILSDGDGPYCEVQSGRFEDQSTWKFLQPYHVESWREYWYPVAGAGPFVKANEEVAFALREKEGLLHVGLYASRPLMEGTLTVRCGERMLQQCENVAAAPGQPFVVAIPEAKASHPDLTIEWADATGRNRLRYQPRPPAPPVPDPPPPPPDTAETRSLAGQRAELRYQMAEAERHYRLALERDPGFGPAHRGLGLIALWRGLWKEAAEHFECALARDPDDAEARYYLGYATYEMGEESTAHFHLWQAARVPAFANAAKVLLAEMAFAQGELAHPLLNDRESSRNPRRRILSFMAARRGRRWANLLTLPEHMRNPGLLEWRECFLAARLVAQEQPQLAETFFRKTEEHLQNHEGRPIRTLEDLFQTWKAHAAGDPEAYLEVAHDYAGAGLCEEAIEVLEEGAAQATSCHPILCYTLAYLLEQVGRNEEAKEWFDKGKSAPGGYCFPHRHESIPVLRRAIEHDPKDARARLYLGTLFYARGRKEEAMSLWDEAIALEPTNAVLRRNRGWAAWKAGDLTTAAAHYDAALAAEPLEYHRYLERDRLAEERGEDPVIRLARLASAPESVRGRSGLVARRVALHILLGEFEEAIALLNTYTFHPWEGELRMRGLYVDAHVGQGMKRTQQGEIAAAYASFRRALEYPRNIRVGKPARPRDAEPLCLAGCTAALLGEREEAASLWQQAAAERHDQPSMLWFYQALALQGLGHSDEARERAEALSHHARNELAKASDSAQGHWLLGLAYFALGRVADGRWHIEQASRKGTAPDFRVFFFGHATFVRHLLESVSTPIPEGEPMR